jgi:hypothetical protein
VESLPGADIAFVQQPERLIEDVAVEIALLLQQLDRALGQHEARLIATVFLGGSVLLTGLVLVAASMLVAPSLLIEVGGQIPDPGATALIRTVAAVLLSVFTTRVATLVMFSTASLGRQTGALPTWLIVVTFVVGVIEFASVTIAEPTLYLFPAWIALVSVVLLVRRPGDGVDAPAAIRP